MTRLPVLAAFLVGTLCGLGASMWRGERSGDGLKPVLHDAAATTQCRTGFSPSPPALHDQTAPAVVIHPTRNLFAYFEPPPPPTLRTVVVPATVVPAQPFVPQPPQPPPFPYRYIGTFGTREKAFAVFAREGEIVNARVGDAVGDRFTLRRIGLESVDLGWDGPSEVRVSAAASPPR